jgi:hypothetical protein
VEAAPPTTEGIAAIGPYNETSPINPLAVSVLMNTNSRQPVWDQLDDTRAAPHRRPSGGGRTYHHRLHVRVIKVEGSRVMRWSLYEIPPPKFREAHELVGPVSDFVAAGLQQQLVKSECPGFGDTPTMHLLAAHAVAKRDLALKD